MNQVHSNLIRRSIELSRWYERVYQNDSSTKELLEYFGF